MERDHLIQDLKSAWAGGGGSVRLHKSPTCEGREVSLRRLELGHDHVVLTDMGHSSVPISAIHHVSLVVAQPTDVVVSHRRVDTDGMYWGNSDPFAVSASVSFD